MSRRYHAGSEIWGHLPNTGFRKGKLFWSKLWRTWKKFQRPPYNLSHPDPPSYHQQLLDNIVGVESGVQVVQRHLLAMKEDQWKLGLQQVKLEEIRAFRAWPKVQACWGNTSGTLQWGPECFHISSLTQLDLDWMFYHTPALVLDAKPPFALKTNISMPTTNIFALGLLHNQYRYNLNHHAIPWS